MMWFTQNSSMNGRHDFRRNTSYDPSAVSSYMSTALLLGAAGIYFYRTYWWKGDSAKPSAPPQSTQVAASSSVNKDTADDLPAPPASEAGPSSQASHQLDARSLVPFTSTPETYTSHQGCPAHGPGCPYGWPHGATTANSLQFPAHLPIQFPGSNITVNYNYNTTNLEQTYNVDQHCLPSEERTTDYSRRYPQVEYAVPSGAPGSVPSRRAFVRSEADYPQQGQVASIYDDSEDEANEDEGKEDSRPSSPISNYAAPSLRGPTVDAIPSDVHPTKLRPNRTLREGHLTINRKVPGDSSSSELSATFVPSPDDAYALPSSVQTGASSSPLQNSRSSAKDLKHETVRRIYGDSLDDTEPKYPEGKPRLRRQPTPPRFKQVSQDDGSEDEKSGAGHGARDDSGVSDLESDGEEDMGSTAVKEGKRSGTTGKDLC